jgi:hypothetical protein
MMQVEQRLGRQLDEMEVECNALRIANCALLKSNQTVAAHSDLTNRLQVSPIVPSMLPKRLWNVP